MANIKKKPSEVKKCLVGVYVTEEENIKLEKICKLKGCSKSEMIRVSLDELLGVKNSRTEEMWKILDIAIRLIDTNENGKRKGV